jgi:hypothetical protein
MFSYYDSDYDIKPIEFLVKNIKLDGINDTESIYNIIQCIFKTMCEKYVPWAHIFKDTINELGICEFSLTNLKTVIPSISSKNTPKNTTVTYFDEIKKFGSGIIKEDINGINGYRYEFTPPNII